MPEAEDSFIEGRIIVMMTYGEALATGCRCCGESVAQCVKAPLGGHGGEGELPSCKNQSMESMKTPVFGTESPVIPLCVQLSSLITTILHFILQINWV